MNEVNYARLGRFIYEHRPKWATGVYVTVHGVFYGKRTNPKKMPKNFFLFKMLGH